MLSQSSIKIKSSTCKDTTANYTVLARYTDANNIHHETRQISKSDRKLNKDIVIDTCRVSYEFTNDAVSSERELGNEPISNRRHRYRLFHGRISDGAYSVRRIVFNYTGKAMVIRSNKQDTTLVVGYDGNWNLDETAIKNYCKQDSCFVERWYDQSSIQNDVFQTDKKRQPLISVNGEIFRANGKPTLYFYDNGVAGQPVCLETAPFHMTHRSSRGNFNAHVTLFVTAQPENQDNKNPYVGLVGKTDGNFPGEWDIYNNKFLVRNFVGSSSSSVLDSYLNKGVNESDELSAWAFTFQTLGGTFFSNHAKAYSYLNGRLNSAIRYDRRNGPISYTSNPQKNTKMVIGSREDGATAFIGKISEVSIFPYFMGPGREGPKTLSATMRHMNNTLIQYYEIGKTLNHLTNDLSVFNLSSKQQEHGVAAYSLRRLAKGYTGAAVKVIRTSDSTWADVYFDATAKLSDSSYVAIYKKGENTVVSDSIYLTDFASGTDCKVGKWYNQMEFDDRDLSQSDISRMPSLVKNGQLQTLYGRPTIRFDTTAAGAQYLATIPFTGFNYEHNTSIHEPVPMDIYVAGGVRNNTQYSGYVSKTGAAGIPYGQNIPGPFDAYDGTFILGPARPVANVNNELISRTLKEHIDHKTGFSIWQFYTEPYSDSYGYKNTKPFASINGVANDQQLHAPSSPEIWDGGQPLVVGSRNDHVTKLDGWVSELILFNSSPSQAGNRAQLINENMVGYYNIGHSGNCLNFVKDEQNYVTLNPTDSLKFYNPGSAYTKEAWIYWHGVNRNEQLISSNDIFIIANGKLMVENDRENNPNGSNARSVADVPMNVWTHVAVTYDTDAGYSLYMNGQPLAITKNGTPRSSTGGKTYLGKHPHFDQYYFNGSMDEVRIWNVARTASQIKAGYNQIISQGVGLTGYYNFNVGTPDGFNTDVTKLKNLVPSSSNELGVLSNFLLQGPISNWVKSQVPIR